MRRALLLVFAIAGTRAEEAALPGLTKPVEILRDRWGVPHIYAENAADLFFAQGWITARDRLFQIDLWRRVNNGYLAEVLGPEMIARDRIARLVRFRGDWNEEWRSYSPDAREIAVAFTNGINAYIRGLGDARPLEFRLAGYGPGLWKPEDVTGRIAGLLMIRNVTREVQRVRDIQAFGLETVQKYLPVDPVTPLALPKGLSLGDLATDILKDYNAAIGPVAIERADSRQSALHRRKEDGDGGDGAEQGSNNWVVSGRLSATGKPLLASDPHRPVTIPSLRKTVHLVAPGWNVIGAGEPALPGIALGHNEEIGFGFTIVGIDQGDVYVERLNPANPDEYWHKGAWRKMDVTREAVPVRGAAARTVELRHTVHGPVIAENLGRNRAYALKWVGSEPGGAGYLPALSLARARNWEEFRRAAASYKVPSENMVYADRAGNIGWIAAGAAPVRKGWNGLLPVPGGGEYEWGGYLKIEEHPQRFNPPEGFLATANHKILPEKYPHALGYEWALPFRYLRILEMIAQKQKFSVDDFREMQQDVRTVTAKAFQSAVQAWASQAGEMGARESKHVKRILAWDGRLEADSAEALVFEVWLAKLPARMFGQGLGARVDAGTVLRRLGAGVQGAVLRDSLVWALDEIERVYGKDESQWRWGRAHTITFRHPLNRPEFNRGPVARPGDGTTVNSTSGSNFRQTNGASYRMILDTSDWDRSVMTNVPGESGDVGSRHYDDLLQEWASGRYHPMPYSRRAVEAVVEERIRLLPKY